MAAGIFFDILLNLCLWLPVALIVFALGWVGLFWGERRKARRLRWLSLFLLCYGACALLINFKYSSDNPTYRMGDEQLKPFLQALSVADSASLSFTPISSEAEIKIYDSKDQDCPLELSVGRDLHPPLDQYVGQFICFQKIDGAYMWVGESELHFSFGERIFMRYGKLMSSDNYSTTHSLVIKYTGKDLRLQKSNLTLEDIQPVLAEWEMVRLASTPSP